MAEFNRKEFGERIKQFRKDKGFSQENLGYAIGKNKATVSRIENGTLLPDAELIYLICRELGITEYELFNSRDALLNKKESKNPFGVNKLYVYLYGYYPTLNKFDKCKFVINIIEKYDYCSIELCDYNSNRIYLQGHLEADSFMAFFRFNNYKPTSIRLECSQFNVNIANGIDGLMKGAFFSTGNRYNTSAKKCIFSTKDLEFTDDMLEELKITKDEFDEMEKINIWYINTENKQDFEQ